MLYYNIKLKNRARELRNNQTDAEKLLWQKLRGQQLRGFRFYRQRIIGNYIVDFYCPNAKIVIELDGSHHYKDNQKEYDQERDHYLNTEGFKVLRYSNLEISKNLDGIILDILNNM